MPTVTIDEVRSHRSAPNATTRLRSTGAASLLRLGATGLRVPTRATGEGRWEAEEWAAAFNLGVLMRVLFGVGKPRTLQGAGGAFACVSCCLWGLLTALLGRLGGWTARLALPTVA